MRDLKARQGDIACSGIGGEAMEEEGLTSLFPIEDLAVMGYRDVVFRLPLLLWRARQTVRAILRQNPDIVVLIDAQVFSKVVAQTLRRRGFARPILLYVAPAVWAWKPERAAQLVGLFDEVLAVLPFEPAAMARLGGPRTTYVGHPALARYAQRTAQPRHGPLLLLPGSRKSEIARHLPMFRIVAERLEAHPAVSGVTMLSTRAQAETLRRAVASWPMPVSIAVREDERQHALETAVCAIAVSGTATLELALAGVPHILTYVAEPAQARMFAKATTSFIGLPNIIAGEAVVPEILFVGAGAPEELAIAAQGLLDDTDAQAAQRAQFSRIRTLMENGALQAPRVNPVDRIADYLALSAGTDRYNRG